MRSDGSNANGGEPSPDQRLRESASQFVGPEI